MMKEIIDKYFFLKCFLSREMIFVKFNVMDFSDDIVQLVERNSFYTES